MDSHKEDLKVDNNLVAHKEIHNNLVAHKEDHNKDHKGTMVELIQWDAHRYLKDHNNLTMEALTLDTINPKALLTNLLISQINLALLKVRYFFLFMDYYFYYFYFYYYFSNIQQTHVSATEKRANEILNENNMKL